MNDPITLAIRRYFEVDDKGTGGPGNTPPANTHPPAPNTDEKTDAEKAAEEAARLAKESKDKEEKKFSQADLDRVINERLKREREASEKKALEKQGEFKALYEDVKPKFDAYESEVPVLREIVNKMIDDKIKDWDADLRSQDPGPTDIKARQTWAEKSAPIAVKLAGTKAPVDGEAGSKAGGKTGSLSAVGYMAGNYQKPVIPGQKTG